VYAKYMDYCSQIFNVLGELSHLVRTIFTDGMHFISLSTRSRTALAAENLFRRKQLAFYQERKVVPRRFDNVTRFILVLLSHGFAWKAALVNVTPKTFIVWHRAGFRVLALEVAARATTDTTGTAYTHSSNGARQSWLGRGTHRQ